MIFKTMTAIHNTSPEWSLSSQVIVVSAGQNNHGDSPEEIAEGIKEICGVIRPATQIQELDFLREIVQIQAELVILQNGKAIINSNQVVVISQLATVGERA